MSRWTCSTVLLRAPSAVRSRPHRRVADREGPADARSEPRRLWGTEDSRRTLVRLKTCSFAPYVQRALA
jgi:hypothetical protein